ncbi:hypothetical protein U1Q18_049271 [Sarracenia purpurea var. burkii]
MILAHSSDAATSNEVENPNPNESKDENDEKTDPALTCVLFGNFGCKIECSTIATVFSTKSTGDCTYEDICQCYLENYDSLEGLFRAKFNANKALNKIKQDEKLAAQVLEILQVPFQTTAQTKRKLKGIVNPEIYENLVNDKTPEKELGLVGETDEPNYDKIKEYVGEKLKPVLKSFPVRMTRKSYEFKLEKALRGKTKEDLQSIMKQIRRTKNKRLNNIVDDYLDFTKNRREKKHR